jgi:hypothetical protein
MEGLAFINDHSVLSDGVSYALLHPGPDRMLIVLRFDDGEAKAGLVGEDVIGALPLLTARRHLPADEDTPVGEIELFTHLEKNVPPGIDPARA